MKTNATVISDRGHIAVGAYRLDSHGRTTGWVRRMLPDRTVGFINWDPAITGDRSDPDDVMFLVEHWPSSVRIERGMAVGFRLVRISDSPDQVLRAVDCIPLTTAPQLDITNAEYRGRLQRFGPSHQPSLPTPDDELPSFTVAVPGLYPAV